MKIKILLLFILAGYSLLLNIFQYKNVQSIKSESQSLQSEINTMITDIAELEGNISAKQEKVTTLQSELKVLEDSLKLLKDENMDLSNKLAELQSEPAAVEIVEEVPTPVEIPQVVDPTPQGNNGLINPNTGAPLQPGDHGVTNGFEWVYDGGSSGKF